MSDTKSWLLLILSLTVATHAAKISRSPRPPPTVKPPKTPRQPPSPLPPTPSPRGYAALFGSDLIWSTYARDCRDREGTSTRLGAAQNAAGPPGAEHLARVVQGVCSEVQHLSWVSSAPRLCALDAFFGTPAPNSTTFPQQQQQPDPGPPSPPLVRVADVANISLLMLTRGTIRPIIDAIQVIVVSPPQPPSVEDGGGDNSGDHSNSIVMDTVRDLPYAVQDALLRAGVNVDIDATAAAAATARSGLASVVSLPVWRASSAPMSELAVACPGLNSWRMGLAGPALAAAVPWFSEALVVGVRVVVRGPGAGLQDGVVMPGVGAVGLRLKPAAAARLGLGLGV